MQDFLEYINYEDLDENDRELADCIGLENFKNLVRNYGGENIYVKVPTNMCIDIRNRHICSEFNGGNYKQLARKYNLSIVSVYRIIEDHYKSKPKSLK